MKYGIAYRLKIKNAERNADFTLNNQTVTVMIYDRSLMIPDSEATDITDLIGAEDPLHISTVDNSEDKFTGIKALQATISFKSDNTYSLNTFADAPIPVGGTDPGDPRWAVTISIGTKIIFTGYLNIEDCSAPFMPYPETVTLTANDGLGTLKNKPLTDFDGITPRNHNRIIDYIVWSLSKTGLSLNLNVLFNIREANNKSKHLFESCYLWAKTFEDEIGTCENCYEVIEKILGEEAFLTQRNGEWWIVRIDDLGDENTRYVSTFDSNGVLISESTPDLSKTIQRGTDIYFSQESTDVSLKRPHEFIKETYQFDFPREIVDNIDFSREETEPFFTENFTEDGISKVRKRYTLSDWKLKAGTENSPAGSVTKTYVERVFVDDYEKERYAVIERPPASSLNYIESNPIPIGINDKFDFNIDFALKDDISGNNIQYEVQLMLYSDSGAKYVYGNDPAALRNNHWAPYGENTAAGDLKLRISFNRDDTNEREYQSVNANVSAAPASGELFIRLFGWYNSDIKLQNLRFDYIPYINGSYAKYSALYHKVSRTIDYTAIREKNVSVSDGIKKLFKGALFTPTYIGMFTANAQFFELLGRYFISFTGNYLAALSSAQTIRITGSAHNDGTYNIINVQYSGTLTSIRVNKVVVGETISVNVDKVRFSLANQFYNSQVYPSIVPGDAIHTYAHIQAFDVWNQHRNTLRKFDFTAQGLTSGSVDAYGGADLPHLNYRYTLGDTSDNTSNRVFMLLTFDWDLRLCEWTGTMVEVFKTDVGKFYEDTDNLEIKYVQ